MNFISLTTEMLMSWTYLIFIVLIGETGAKVILQGAKKLTELMDELHLNCVFEDSDFTVVQLSILHGKKTIAKLVNVKKVEVLNNELDIHATGLIDLRSSSLNITIENQKHGNYAFTCQATIINKKDKKEKVNSSPFKVTITKLPLERLTEYVERKFKTFDQAMTIEDRNKLLTDHEKILKEIEKLKVTVEKKTISGDSTNTLHENFAEKINVDSLKSGAVQTSDIDGLKHVVSSLKREIENLKAELRKMKSTIADKKSSHHKDEQIEKLTPSFAEKTDLDIFQKQLEHVQKEVDSLKNSVIDKKEFADFKSNVLQRNSLDNFTSIINDFMKLENLTTIITTVKNLENITSAMVKDKDFKNFENEAKSLNKTIAELKSFILNNSNNLENLTTIINDVKLRENLTSFKFQSEKNDNLKSNMDNKNYLDNLKKEIDRLKETAAEKVELDNLKSSIKNDLQNLENVSTMVNVLEMLENISANMVQEKDFKNFDKKLKSLNVSVTELKASTKSVFHDLETLKTLVDDKLENVTLFMIDRQEIDNLKSNTVDKKEMENFQNEIKKFKETAAKKVELEKLKSSFTTDSNEPEILKTIKNKIQKLEHLTETMAQREELENLKSEVVSKENMESFEIRLQRLNETIAEYVLNDCNLTSTMIQRKELENFKAEFVNKYELDNFKKELRKLKETTAVQGDLDDLRSYMADRNELQRLKSSLDTFIINEATQSSLIHQKFEMLNVSTPLSMKHTIDKGSFDCDNNLDKTDGKGLRYKETVIQFRNPFSKPPTILVGLRSADIKGSIRIVADYNEVTTEGFIGICGTWYNGFINFARYDWLAFD